MRAPALPVEGDTIAAISTPYGVGGIGIVRISGPDSERIALTLFRPKKPIDRLRSHHLHYGHILHSKGGPPIDEVLLAWMRAPHTYTREDMVEIQCHGGPLPVRGILEVVLSWGARLAEPGEFTRRAFLNGRIDLAQAEAIVDIVEAKNLTALRFAQSQLCGVLSDEILRIQEETKSVLVEVEAWLDFPEEDIPGPQFEAMRVQLEGWIGSITNLMKTYEEGHLHRDGVNLVIVGEPNVGKSTLLNALLGKQRAIVSPLPGTTRDYLEEFVLLGGIPVRLVDTAGLRETHEEIEAQGVTAARRKIAEADLLLYVVDACRLEAEGWKGIPAGGEEARTLVVLNKVDLVSQGSVEDTIRRIHPLRCAAISALYGQGMDCLRQMILDQLVTEKMDLDCRAVVSNLRHQKALESCREALRAARGQLGLEEPPGDLLASDLRRAVRAMGEILGQTTPEEILNRIFDSFCIGK